MKQLRIVLVALLVVSFAAGPFAQARNVKDEAGYVDLDWIEIPDHAAEVQDIDLTEILKAVAKDAQDTGDDEISQILAMVRSVRVKGFGLDDTDSAMIEKTVDKVTSRLKKDGWKRLIYLKDEGEVMSVSTRYDGDDLVGMMVVAYEAGEEVMFANIVGDLDLPKILALVGSMDGDGLEELLEGLEGMEGGNIHIDH